MPDNLSAGPWGPRLRRFQIKYVLFYRLHVRRIMIMMIKNGCGSRRIWRINMNIRKPMVAGRFYPESKNSIQTLLDECLEVHFRPNELPKMIVGGIVPHAGWICSGAVAGKVFQAIKLAAKADTIVIYGAVHRYGITKASVYPSGMWETPLGQVAVDESLASEVLTASNLIKGDPNAHQFEHSIEVQIPFIQELFPDAKILPIMIPPTVCAGEVGFAVGEAIKKLEIHAVCVGSSDLTHYGPSYGFTAQGRGQEGIQWAKEVNDRGLLDLVEKLDAVKALEYAERSHAACGAGAIAASIASAVSLGADQAKVLEHVNSYEVLNEHFGDGSDDAVGFAGIVFGRD